MLYVCQAMSTNRADECGFDLFGDIQEMIVLIAAFTLGWCAFSRLMNWLTELRLKALAEASMSPVNAPNPSSASDQAFEESSSPASSSDSPSSGSRADMTTPDRFASRHLSLARRLAKRQDFLSSQNCIEEIRKNGGKVDLPTYRSLLVASARAGNMELAQTCFQHLVSDGLEPDFLTFSCMIRGLCNVGKTEEAMSHFQVMLENSLRPDALLCDAMLESCASRNLVYIAENVLATMEELAVRPSNCTLAACIKLYSLRGELSRAMAVFDEMPKKHDFEPNAYVYGSVIAACYRHGRSDLALKAYQRMSAAGCCPNAHTYECLVRCCLQTGKLEDAISLVDRALCLLPAAGEHRTFVDLKLIEELLALLGRRHQAARLAMPLLQRLQDAEFDISEEVSRGIFRAAESEARTKTSMQTKQQNRRAEFDRWRDFPSLSSHA